MFFDILRPMKTIMTFLSCLSFSLLAQTEPFFTESGQAFSFKDQEDIAFDPRGKFSTNSVLIVRDQTILYERYANGFDKEKPHRLWSMTKSLSSLLVGMRLKDLDLTPERPISADLPTLSSYFKDQITVRHLLHMSSGLNWNEFYERNPFQSDVIEMLYLSKDMGKFVASKESIAAPGTRFHYSSGETNLLMDWFKKTFKNDFQAHDLYPQKRLFDPLEVKDATWEQDASGTFVGSSYAYMSPRSLAKIGLLVLNEGKWPLKESEEQSQLVDPLYLKDSFKLAPSVCQTNLSNLMKGSSYGQHWWLNKACPGKEKPFDKVSEDIILAYGHHGQTLVLFPKHNVVAIRFGADKEGTFSRYKWITSISKELNND